MAEARLKRLLTQVGVVSLVCIGTDSFSWRAPLIGNSHAQRCRHLPFSPVCLPSSTSTTTQLGFFNFGKKPEAVESKEVPSPTPLTPEEEPDLVEKIFSVFFGKPEESPLGLKRFGKERFPEQYPATVDEWAEPVASDNSDMAMVRPLLKNTNLEERALRVTYDANKMGWSATKFHQAVDRQGGALVVVATKTGIVAGGYNPKGWVGYGENRGSIAAFLFVRNKDKTFTKLRKVGGAGMAQMDNPECGPCFGADSLVIPLAADNPRLARSKLGSYYERFADGTNSVFGKGLASVQLADLKVYHGVYAEDEYVPFTDAEPFALY
jgi:TLD